jgi:DNA repair protein RadC
MFKQFTPSEIKALQKANKIMTRALMQESPIFNTPQIVKTWASLHCAEDNAKGQEVFTVLYLNAQHEMIEAVRHFTGTLTQTSVYPREIVKHALSANCAAVIFMHNHPSGCPEPSRADELLTQTLKSCLALVDVRVLDHFIVADFDVISMAEKGLI